MYGDHIWFETNVSGDYCYVGEQHCIARALVSSSHSLLSYPSIHPSRVLPHNFWFLLQPFVFLQLLLFPPLHVIVCWDSCMKSLLPVLCSLSITAMFTWFSVHVYLNLEVPVILQHPFTSQGVTHNTSCSPPCCSHLMKLLC